MSLFEQFQTIIGSIVFGSLSLFTWTLFNRIFYSKKLYIIRFHLEIILFCYIAYLYYIFLGTFSSGVFNIFYIPSLILGGYIYYRFYAYHFESLFEEVASSLYKKLSKTTNRVISVFCLVIFMASLVYLGVVGYQLFATYRENERLKKQYQELLQEAQRIEEYNKKVGEDGYYNVYSNSEDMVVYGNGQTIIITIK